MALWAWDISALVYARTYGPLAHSIDTDVLQWLGPDRIRDRVFVDVGCGPGVVTRKLLEHGAARVLCIDVAQGMLDQLPADPRVVPIKAAVGPGDLWRIIADHAPDGVDVVLFKRSLYHAAPVAEQVLRDAADSLREGGSVIVVHPERALVPYAFGNPVRVRSHTPYHLFNRTISRIGARIGAEDYTVHTREELRQLAVRAVGGDRVHVIPSDQHAFNLIAIAA